MIPFAIFVLRSGMAILMLGSEAPVSWFSTNIDVLFIAIFLILNGFGEETGWRGFALPRLQQHYGSLGASIILGVIWAFWHLPSFFIQGSAQYGESIIEYVLLLVSWTIIMTMLYNKAKCSVFVPIVLHETQNLIAFAMNSPSGTGLFALPLWVLLTLLSIPFLPKPLFKGGNQQ